MEIQHSIEWFRKRLGNFTGVANRTPNEEREK